MGVQPGKATSPLCIFTIITVQAGAYSGCKTSHGERTRSVRSKAYPGLCQCIRPNEHAQRACRRGPAGCVQRAQRAQQPPRRPQRVRRRRVQPPQAVGGVPAALALPSWAGLAGVPLGRVRQALARLAQRLPGRRRARRPERQRQRQRRQVGVEDLRPRRGRQRGALGPQPQAQAGAQPACDSAASASRRRPAGHPACLLHIARAHATRGRRGRWNRHDRARPCTVHSLQKAQRRAPHPRGRAAGQPPRPRRARCAAGSGRRRRRAPAGARARRRPPRARPPPSATPPRRAWPAQCAARLRSRRAASLHRCWTAMTAGAVPLHAQRLADMHACPTADTTRRC
jgi:hypothetical protein